MPPAPAGWLFRRRTRRGWGWEPDNHHPHLTEVSKDRDLPYAVRTCFPLHLSLLLIRLLISLRCLGRLKPVEALEKRHSRGRCSRPTTSDAMFFFLLIIWLVSFLSVDSIWVSWLLMSFECSCVVHRDGMFNSLDPWVLWHPHKVRDATSPYSLSITCFQDPNLVDIEGQWFAIRVLAITAS
jgi:hypothetical protein